MSLIIARPERTRLVMVMGTHRLTRSLTSGANAAHHLLLKPRKANKSPGSRPALSSCVISIPPAARRAAATQVISTIHYSGNLPRDPTTTSLVLMLLLLVRGQILAHLLASLGKARSSLAYDGTRAKSPPRASIRPARRVQIVRAKFSQKSCCQPVVVVRSVLTPAPSSPIGHHHHHLMRE